MEKLVGWGVVIGNMVVKSFKIVEIIYFQTRRSCQFEMKEKKREISMLSEENSALKSVMKGQEGEMQREINNLLVKMKGLSAKKTELI